MFVKKITSYEGRKTSVIEDAPAFLEDFTNNFQSFSINVLVTQSHFEIIIQQQMIIQYEKSCLTCILDRQIEDFKGQ